MKNLLCLLALLAGATPAIAQSLQLMPIARDLLSTEQARSAATSDSLASYRQLERCGDAGDSDAVQCFDAAVDAAVTAALEALDSAALALADGLEGDTGDEPSLVKLMRATGDAGRRLATAAVAITTP